MTPEEIRAIIREMPDDLRDGAPRPLNVVLFSASYPPRVGGLETAVARLARELRHSGHHVTVVTNRYPRSLARSELVGGILVRRMLFPDLFIPRSAWRGGARRAAALLVPLPLAPFALLRLWLLLRTLRPHVVNVHYLSAPSLYIALLSSLRLLRTRVVVSCHGSDLMTAPAPTGSLAASRWVLSHAHAVTTCSVDLMSYVDRVAAPTRGQARMVVYNGVDADEFAGIAPFAHPRPYILSAGRLVETKGGRILIEAFALARARGVDCDLIIAGGGPEEKRLRGLAADLDIASHVHFAGAVGRARLGALYQGCALFVFPSIQEAFGLVALEAMTCSRAVVATRVGGIPETVVDGETGLLTRVADPVDLADKLVALLNDPARAAAMGRRGRARAVAEFTWQRVAARYLAAYGLTSIERGSERPIDGSRTGVGGRGRGAPRRYNNTHDGGLDRLLGKQAVPILMYHQVVPATATGVGRGLRVAPEAFDAQMRLLRRLGWRTLRLADLVGLLEGGLVLPRRRFVLTFDDAFLGVLEHAAPILADLGFAATVFAPSGLVGSCRALDGGPDHEEKRLMSWGDLRAWRAGGHDIGAHTRTHPHLPRLDAVACAEELMGARTDIATALGEAPSLFAYPYGDWTQAVAAAVQGCGYTAACTTRFGRVTVAAHRFALPRISVGADLDLPHFAYRLARADHIAAVLRAPRAAAAR